MELWLVDLYDAFRYALRDNYYKLSKELKDAYMKDEFRQYIPSAYLQEA